MIVKRRSFNYWKYLTI